jgi:CRISPR/Cas system CSM-associated protein Csm4 (group 5 of RAMP superfamily)
VLAFQADITRVATFVLANEGSNKPYPFIKVPEGHHDLSHHGNDQVKKEKIKQINLFHVSQLAYLLEKLKATKEGEGNLLDHSMIAYGSGNSDGNAHNHDDLPILLAGGGCGTLSSGRHLRFSKETPLNNLWLSMLNRMDINIDRLGDSTGALANLK